MYLSSKARYAVTAMLDLAIHADSGAVPLASIAKRQAISQAFLEQIFRQLRAASLVQATRGPGGGYRLLKPADLLSVADIVSAVDELSLPATELESCETPCMGDALWSCLCTNIEEFLASVTLQQLMTRESAGARAAHYAEDEGAADFALAGITVAVESVRQPD